MLNLAKDIVDRGEIYEFPLVSPNDEKFIVFDGNRRVTCLKLLDEPRRAPTVELQAFFRQQRARWNGSGTGRPCGQSPVDRLCQISKAVQSRM